MSILEETIARIQPLDTAAMQAVGEKLDDAKGLGHLRELLLRYAGITGESTPEPPKKCTIICCSDHGVAAMGVSAYPPETTVQMTANYLISRGAAANAAANFASSDLLVVDMGIAGDTGNIPGLVNCHIADGTANSALGPAMTREQAITSIESGIKIVSACAENGYRCFLPGEMGIANTTSSAAICAAICGISPEEATGRGTNISDERLAKKVSVVRQILETNHPDPTDGLDVLAKVGGFELGCIAGIILGAAAHRSIAVLDGFNAGAAALIAATIAPLSREYIMASHLATERGHQAILKKLGLSSCMDLKLRLGETCGSSLAATFLDTAIHACNALEEDASVDFHREQMPTEPPTVTDKTFNFYLHTMPVLDRQSMELCQSRIDNLAKPVDCLGYLEQIATEIAGILADDRPETGLHFDLLCFNKSKSLSDTQKCLMHAFAESAGAEVTLACLRPGLPPTAAFDFGRVTAEDITFTSPLIGVALTENRMEDPCGTKAARLKEALLHENGSLRYAPDEFLAHVPKDLKVDAAALMGAIIAAAHNSSLVILDDESTEIIARYAESLCPAIKPYILHIQPFLLQMGIKTAGGITACLGKSIVDASLHMLNDMKTFAETSVPTANDGPGTRRQSRRKD
ncbi:MAG: nicotinate-nucleotide--dimethylbenzimidazole phosphoribosyltransferase [Selenomonadaceae bacterium]|nr:nicotinate-nucleotide--dimethylbenzimidazole phosphoribosyltransferase [Selenomonadaceae bacterium]